MPRVKGAKKGKAEAGDATAVKPKREPTEYNLYMRDEMPRLKQEHPTATHMEAFTEVAKQVRAGRGGAAAPWRGDKRGRRGGAITILGDPDFFRGGSDS